MWYIGIDPGKSGGIALIGEVEVEVYPYSDEKLIEIAGRCSGEKCMCCVESVHALPKQGVSSTFSFGKSAGFIEGVLRSFGIAYQLIPPQRWKKEFGLNSDKQKSIEVCKKLFPQVNLLATERSRKPHDGMAEALLIAEYCRRKL